jgi:hypothetical protein
MTNRGIEANARHIDAQLAAAAVGEDDLAARAGLIFSERPALLLAAAIAYLSIDSGPEAGRNGPRLRGIANHVGLHVKRLISKPNLLGCKLANLLRWEEAMAWVHVHVCM